jgi:hypothetical protein
MSGNTVTFENALEDLLDDAAVVDQLGGEDDLLNSAKQLGIQYGDKLKVVLLLAVALLLLTGVSALAADSCSVWMKQADGTFWRSCVDDKGQQYCQTADSNGNNVTRVSCK